LIARAVGARLQEERMMKRWMLIALTGAALSCGGTDSGAPVISAGDAGMISDGTSDAGSNAPDAGPTSSVNGCTASKYVDATAAGASRAVAFTFFKYSPACLTIATGQSVTFSGDFYSHPLRAGVAPSAGGGAGPSQNPISSVNGGTTASFTFAQPGIYPYFCAAHESIGMYGAIQVR
jgi:plastocyanin